jgi:hypothetical protein
MTVWYTVPKLTLYIKHTITNINGCILWTGAREKSGYGNIDYQKKRYKAHRFAYEIFIGPIPKNKELDHICRNKSCVNPEHLRAVTHQENMLNSAYMDRANARTHCKNGHELAIFGYRSRTNSKRCKGCDKLNNEKRRQRERRSS